jgi:hypothetical protein
VVDTWADLNIGLQARTVAVASWSKRLLMLTIIALVLAGLGLLARSVAKTQRA